MERKAAQMNKNQSDGNEEILGANEKSDKENILNWDEKGVRNFLLKHNLFAMVPLCDGINGEELSNLYIMCKTNSTSMYRSLKFLRFSSRMRVICDDGLPSNTKNGKKTRKIHSSTDE